MTQPAALRLADFLLDWLGNNVESADLEGACVQAAAELRRLHQSEREAWRYADELEQHRKALEAALRQAAEALNDTAYRLEQSRIWGGMEWSYHPMHPVKYLPVRDKAREAATTAKQALGEA